MKRTLMFIVGLGCVFSVLLALLLYEPQDSYQEDAKRFVCIMNSSTGYYWGNIMEGIAAADEEYGTYTKYYYFERFDTDEQLRLLQELKYIHVDGVITVGEPYSEELNEEMASIVASGIPLILLDTDSEASNRTCYIGSDNYSAGQMAAEKILEETDGDAHVVVFVSGLDQANQLERLTGFQDTIAQYDSAEILEVCENQLEKAEFQEDMERLLETYPDLNAVFCAEAGTSQYVGFFTDTIQNAHEMVIVGFDDLASTVSFVSDGTYTATIVQKGFEMGYQAVNYLVNYLEGDSGGMSEIYTDVICVTQDTVDAYVAGDLVG